MEGKFLLAVPALAIGAVLGYYGSGLFDVADMTPYQRCVDDASRRPTNNGVRAAFELCRTRFSPPSGLESTAEPVAKHGPWNKYAEKRDDLCLALKNAKSTGATDDARRLEEFINSNSLECE